MKTKKIAAVLLTCIVAIGLMAGCGASNTNQSASNNDSQPFLCGLPLTSNTFIDFSSYAYQFFFSFELSLFFFLSSTIFTNHSTIFGS